MNASTRARDSAKDIARIIGCVAVLVSHAVLAYCPQSPTDMLWPIRDSVDSGESSWFIGVFYYARFIGVGIFMYIAGELTRRSLESDKPSEFLKRRSRKLGRFLLLGIITTLPLTYFIWAADAVDRGYIRWEQFFDFRLSDADKSMLIGPAHLWFIEYLMIITAVAAMLVRVFGQCALRNRRYAQVWCIAIMFLCAWLDPTMITGFRNSFIPRPSFLIFNACIFAAGWLASGPTRSIALPLGLSTALFFIRPEHASTSALFIASAAALSLPAIGGIMGWCARYHSLRALTQQLADFSPTVYIAHLPIVCGMQYLMKSCAMPTPFKAIITTLATITVSLCFASILRARTAAAIDAK